MSLAELKAKIIKDAEADAREIRNKAEEKVKKIREQADADLSRLKQKAETEANRLAEERYQNIVTLAKVEGKNKVLSVKQKMLEQVFKEAHKHLEELPRERFLSFARQLLLQHPPQEETLVMVGLANEKYIDEKFIEELNAKLAPPGRFVLVENDRGFDFGFYLITDMVEVDLTFRSILRTIREELEMDIIKTLFGKG